MTAENMPLGQIEDPEEARRVAEAEQPWRDAARGPGQTPQGKALNDRFAERAGAFAASDIDAEKMNAFRGTVEGRVRIDVQWRRLDLSKEGEYVMDLLGFGSEAGDSGGTISLGPDRRRAESLFKDAKELKEKGQSTRTIRTTIVDMVRRLDQMNKDAA